MHIQFFAAIAAGASIAAMGAAALAGHVTSIQGWVLVAVLALLTLLGAFWLWNLPRESMSESIQKALR